MVDPHQIILVAPILPREIYDPTRPTFNLRNKTKQNKTKPKPKKEKEDLQHPHPLRQFLENRYVVTYEPYVNPRTMITLWYPRWLLNNLRSNIADWFLRRGKSYEPTGGYLRDRMQFSRTNVLVQTRRDSDGGDVGGDNGNHWYCTVLYCTVLYCTVQFKKALYSDRSKRGGANYGTAFSCSCNKPNATMQTRRMHLSVHYTTKRKYHLWFVSHTQKQQNQFSSFGESESPRILNPIERTPSPISVERFRSLSSNGIPPKACKRLKVLESQRSGRILHEQTPKRIFTTATVRQKEILNARINEGIPRGINLERMGHRIYLHRFPVENFRLRSNESTSDTYSTGVQQKQDLKLLYGIEQKFVLYIYSCLQLNIFHTQVFANLHKPFVYVSSTHGTQRGWQDIERIVGNSSSSSSSNSSKSNNSSSSSSSIGISSSSNSNTTTSSSSSGSSSSSSSNARSKPPPSTITANLVHPPPSPRPPPPPPPILLLLLPLPLEHNVNYHMSPIDERIKVTINYLIHIL
ncbi:hypothetical protein V1478_016991 [Vespula squamosa]|uniref:Uncharacterized protein n=1 Tax=Vespula squamosa TaxID=30214 RepID=A0ABD1ZY40_VESSQ